ncbi:MAG: GGDEF domain-containing protein [Erysipelotrichaceae bacterium]|nr:GGDEF domain-containing protein [Erysipelotrichaceae bacterium]
MSLISEKISFINDGSLNSYRMVEDKISEHNYKSLLSFCVFLKVVLGIMSILSFVIVSLQRYRMVYIGIFLLSGIILILLSGIKDNKRQVRIVMYMFIMMVMSMGIILGTIIDRNIVATSYIALILVTPQLFIDRPERMCAAIFLSSLLFIVMVVNFKATHTFGVDILNAVVFSLISIFLYIYNSNNRINQYHLEKTIRDMAEYDELTGLKNRNAYEKTLKDNNINNKKDLFCLYVDVNGLHELNNSMGHEAGDKMLKYIAKEVQILFGKKDTYRIGGDEYLVLSNLNENILNEKVKILKETVEKENYHIAVGSAYLNDEYPEVDVMIKEAEKRMYEDKKKYYENNNMDRRRKR